MNTDDCEDPATRASDDKKPDRDWITDAILCLRELDCLVRGIDCPQHTCPICLVRGEHRTDCKLRLVLRHAEHSTTPADGSTRQTALRVVGRLTYFWGFRAPELEQACQEAQNEHQRTEDARAEGQRPNNWHEVDEAAGSASAGIEDLADAIADDNMVEALVHAGAIAELVQKAAQRTRDEAGLEPPDLNHIRETTSRTAQAVDYLAGGIERLIAHIMGAEPPADAWHPRGPGYKPAARPREKGVKYRDAAHARHAAEQASGRAKRDLVHYLRLALPGGARGEGQTEIESIVDNIVEAATASATGQLLAAGEQFRGALTEARRAAAIMDELANPKEQPR